MKPLSLVDDSPSSLVGLDTTADPREAKGG
jgi:hypothetical protein